MYRPPPPVRRHQGLPLGPPPSLRIPHFAPLLLLHGETLSAPQSSPQTFSRPPHPRPPLPPPLSRPLLPPLLPGQLPNGPTLPPPTRPSRRIPIPSSDSSVPAPRSFPALPRSRIDVPFACFAAFSTPFDTPLRTLLNPSTRPLSSSRPPTREPTTLVVLQLQYRDQCRPRSVNGGRGEDGAGVDGRRGEDGEGSDYARGEGRSGGEVRRSRTFRGV